MPMSEEKISHLSHLILNAMEKEGKARLLGEGEKVLREIKRIIHHELEAEEEIDGIVRAKLATYSRPLPEGSREWEVLYQKTYQEELEKRRR